MNLTQIVKLLFFKCFFFISIVSFSQISSEVDSLVKILETQNITGKERSKLLMKIAFNHPDRFTALSKANEAVRIGRDINDPILIAEAWEIISLIQYELGNNTKSFKAALTALQLYEDYGDTERQAASYSQLANNFLDENNYTQAILYLKKAKYIYDKSDVHGNQIGVVLNLGEAYRLNGYLDSAKICFNKTLEWNKFRKNKIIQGFSLGNLGMIYAEQNQLVKAKKKLNEALIILESLDDSYATSIYLMSLGQVYLKENNKEKAEKTTLKALRIAQQAGLKKQVRDGSAQLTSFYQINKDYAKALRYQQLYQVYQDSLVNKENVREIEQIKAGHEIEKKETKIRTLNAVNSKQKQIVFLLSLGIVSIFFFGFLLYRANRKVKKSNTLLSHQKVIIGKREKEKAMLLKELNHRVKNNLQMISSLLNIQSYELTGHPAQEAIVDGKYRVEALALVHQKLYQDGADTRISLKTYIEELVLGLFHGYNAGFSPDFDIADISVHIDKVMPLALIINELITNSLKYAFKNGMHPSLKIIVRQQVENQLQLEIIDNGIGFVSDLTEKKSTFGIKLTRSLIEQLEGTLEKIHRNGTHWKMNIKIV